MLGWERRLIQLSLFRLFDSGLLQIYLFYELDHSQLAIDELVINVSLADFRLFRFVQPLHLLSKLALKVLLFSFLLPYAF